LYENRGHANGGSELGQASGIQAMRLTGSHFGEGKAIGGWRMHLVPDAGDRPEVKSDFDDADWKVVATDKKDADQLTSDQCAVFRANIELSAPDLKGASVVLKFGRIDDRGWVFVNGENVGQATDWSRAWSFDLTSNLHPGRNVVAVLVQNDGGSGGLGLPELAMTSGGAPVTPEAIGRPAGDEQQWWKPDLKEQGWRSITISELASGPQKDPLLTWYRMKFSLPVANTHVWEPWHLHLNAAGNGFLYLNGHALGRYWQAGPQHDFFLPECWLNFGDGQTNEVTLNLRSVDGVATVQSVAVQPYAGYAEYR
jgi:hypothetical protein